MTLFFNLQVFESLAAENPKRALELLIKLHHGGVPKRSSDIQVLQKLRHGTAFLGHPKRLFSSPKSLDVLYIIQYIRLAGRRDYFLYKQGVTWLILDYYPDLKLSVLTRNPLLKIDNNRLIFKFEQD